MLIAKIHIPKIYEINTYFLCYLEESTLGWLPPKIWNVLVPLIPFPLVLLPGVHYKWEESINWAYWASEVVLVIKNPPTNLGDIRDTGSIFGSGRSPGGHGNPLQYSCLKNPMDRGAWQATVHWVTKNWTWLKRLSRHTYGLFSYQQLK